jgi:hypothetical protein
VFVEIIEQLRCPRPHDESPLVVAATRSEARHIRDGTLGCPVCSAEFVLADGIVTFDTALPAPPSAPSAESAMRLGAFLELTDARGFAVLCGRWGAHAGHLLGLAQTPLVLVNPPEIAVGLDVAAIIRTSGPLPFATGSARAIALDDVAGLPDPADAMRVVRSGGRVVGPVSLALPHGVSEIVRDEREWVGDWRGGAPPQLIPLRRAY